MATDKMETVSRFCFQVFLAAMREEFGDEIEFVDMNGRSGEPVKLGVNWCAKGTQDPYEAARFAGKLTNACAIAATHPMNGARMIYKY